jgi:hypothetical protein
MMMMIMMVTFFIPDFTSSFILLYL